jgi:hypothetical protein
VPGKRQTVPVQEECIYIISECAIAYEWYLSRVTRVLTAYTCQWVHSNWHMALTPAKILRSSATAVIQSGARLSPKVLDTLNIHVWVKSESTYVTILGTESTRRREPRGDLLSSHRFHPQKENNVELRRIL